MTIKREEFHMLYALLKRNEEKLARPLADLLIRFEKYLYQNLSIKEIEDITHNIKIFTNL